jgi:hypothetical protein
MLRKSMGASLEIPANLCRAFHNVRLSITSVLGLEVADLELEDKITMKPDMVEE